MVLDGDDAHRLADLVGYFLLGRARAFTRHNYYSARKLNFIKKQSIMKNIFDKSFFSDIIDFFMDRRTYLQGAGKIK